MKTKAAPRRTRTPRARPTNPAGPAETDWRDEMMARLRGVIQQADPAAVEEVRWRKPSNPDGVPVWSHDGMICVGNILKNAVRLTFPQGAEIRDPKRLFNARLDSRTVRAIDVHEGETVNRAALKAIVVAAVRLNQAD